MEKKSQFGKTADKSKSKKYLKKNLDLMSNYKLFPTMYISHIAQYLELKNIIQTSAFNTTERSTSQFIWKKRIAFQIVTQRSHIVTR